MADKARPIVAADIGGTHARFALAWIESGRLVSLEDRVTVRTAAHSGFESAWEEFGRSAGPLPTDAAIAIAGPVIAERVQLTNGKWLLDIGALRTNLGFKDVTVLNDFAAVAHAVANAPADQLVHVAGPEQPLPDEGTVTVIGPGTGLGISHFHRFGGGYHVLPGEGGHIGFAPQDSFDDRLLETLRARHGRVVTERVHAGPGIADIYATLGGTELSEPRSVWEQGVARTDELAARAVDRFCASLGTVAGDYALAHGASAVVLAGSLALQMREILPTSHFGERFVAKPHYEAMMRAIPIKLFTDPQPGLRGAAIAFAQAHP